MSQQSIIGPFIDIFNLLLVFLRRPAVQVQLGAIVIVLVAAYIVARLVSAIIARLFRWKPDDFYEKRARLFSRVFVIAFFRAIAFPALALIALTQMQVVMRQQGLFTGLMGKFMWLLWTLLIFQILITLIYSYFDNGKRVRRYHYRLFLPLIFVIIILEIVASITNIQILADIVIANLFDSPVTLGALFIATVGLYFWTDAAHAVDEFLYYFFTSNTNLDKGSVKATLTLLRYMLIVVGVAFALSQLRLNTTTVAAITGGLSVGVGFALREILSNFLSGILLLFERSLHPGDVIEVNNQLGTVENLSIRATTVRTLNNVEVVIPNQIFFTDSFVTYTGSDQTVRSPIFVRASCENDLEALIGMLIATANEHDEVLQSPPPNVFFLDFGDNVISFQVNIWLDSPLKIPSVTSEVRRMIWRAFADANIDLTFPDMALHFPDDWSLKVNAPQLARANGSKGEPVRTVPHGG